MKSIWSSGRWSVIFAIMLLSFLTPFSIITASFFMIPLVVMVVTLGLRRFALHLLVVWAVIYLLTTSASFSLLLISLFFLGPAMVIGVLYRQGRAAHLVVAASVLTFIAEMIVIFLIMALFGVNLVDEAAAYVRESFETFSQLFATEVPAAYVDQMIYVMTQAIPIYMISFALYYTIITHWLARKILIKMRIKIAGLPPVKDWMVPRSLVWYFVVALLISFIVPLNSGSMMAMILNNLVPLLTLVFCVQAVSFLFYLSDVKRWGVALPIVGIIACFIFPTMMSLLGVIDIMFGLRKNLHKQK